MDNIDAINKRQKELLEEYMKKKPVKHRCTTCEYSAYDSERRLRCLHTKSENWFNIVSKHVYCSKWEKRHV